MSDRVLIVEDDPEVAKAIAEGLAHCGREAIVCYNTEAAETQKRALNASLSPQMVAIDGTKNEMVQRTERIFAEVEPRKVEQAACEMAQMDRRAGISA